MAALLAVYAAANGIRAKVTLDVTLPDVQDAESAARIVAAAHQVCPYSNATRGNVEVDLKANGKPVALSET